MQAIITKYIPATNYKPSRLRAKCERGSLMVSYDHGLDIDENHVAACAALCAKFDAEDVKKYGSQAAHWSRAKASGVIPNGCHVHVFMPRNKEGK
jgi:hypothetical protein